MYLIIHFLLILIFSYLVLLSEVSSKNFLQIIASAKKVQELARESLLAKSLVCLPPLSFTYVINVYYKIN